MSIPEPITITTQTRDAIRRLSSIVNEAWDGHRKRIMGRASLSRIEIGYENFLFEASDWVQDLNRLFP